MKVFRSVLLMALTILLAACDTLDRLPPASVKDFKPKIPIQRGFAITDLGGYGSDASFFSLGFNGAQFFHLTPAVSEGQVVVAGDRGDLTAVNAHTAKFNWMHHLKMPFSSGIAKHGSIAVIGANDGRLLAFDWQSGERLWVQQLDSSVLAKPSFTNDGIYVRTENDSIYRLDPKQGKVLWRFHEDPSSMVIHDNSSPVVVSSYVFAGLSQGQLVVLSKSHGVLLGRHQLFVADGNAPSQRMMDIVANPVLAFPLVVVASAHGGVAAYDMKNNRVVWRLKHNTVRNLACQNGVLYMVDTESNVLAIDIQSGHVRWQQKGLAQHQLTAPVIMGDTLLVADAFGGAMWMSRKDGSFLAHEQPASSSISVSPIVSGHSAYFYSLWGQLSQYILKS